MGQRVGCRGDHDLVVVNLGAGIARMECRLCDTVIVDLDAAEDGSPAVSAPGLFGPSKPTIFSVLGEEDKNEEAPADEPRGPRHGGRFAFGGPAPRR